MLLALLPATLVIGFAWCSTKPPSGTQSNGSVRTRRGWFVVENGEYSLVHDGTVDVGALLRLIHEAEFVEPESFKPLLT